MQTLLNMLYVFTEGSYVHIDHETIKIEQQGETKLQVPLLHLNGIIVFGNVLVSPFAIHRLAKTGRCLVFFDRSGRFKARIVGSTKGNVLLRIAQHKFANTGTTELAKSFVAGKIQNMRQVLLRSARDKKKTGSDSTLQVAISALSSSLKNLSKQTSLDTIRGVEGQASKVYFGCFSEMIRVDKTDFPFSGRNRRPPKDRTNAVLSFLYSMLCNDIISALEGVGLDPQIGFYHQIRSGRPALALDMMEEFRPIIADRLALALINRQQLKAKDFNEHSGGSVLLNDRGRKTTVVAYQKKKRNIVSHSLLKQKIPIGLLWHIQSRLLARYLRKDIPNYIPYLVR